MAGSTIQLQSVRQAPAPGANATQSAKAIVQSLRSVGYREGSRLARPAGRRPDQWQGLSWSLE